MVTTRNSSAAIEVSRKLAAWIGSLAVLPSIGGMATGLALSNGHYLIVAAMATSVALIAYLWWSFARDDDNTTGLTLLGLLAFVSMSGLALYLNLIYIFWFAGYDLPIGAVRNGTMAEHRFSGPLVLIFAISAWMALRVGKNSR